MTHSKSSVHVLSVTFALLFDVAIGAAVVDLKLQRAPAGFYTVTLDVTGRRMSVLLDTGSRDFWVSSGSVLHGEPAAHGTRSTYGKYGGVGHVLMPGSPFHVEYDTDSVAGAVQSGTLTLFEKSGDPVSMTCEYGHAQKNAGTLLNRSVDGVWGLAPGGSMESLVHCLYRQKAIQHRVVTLCLSDSSGLMRFGGSPNWWTVKLATVGVDSSWAVKLEGIALRSNGSNSLQTVVDTPAQVVLDTGSQGLRGPSGSIRAIAEAIGAHQSGPEDHFQLLCSRLSSVPDLVLQLPMQANRLLRATTNRSMTRVKSTSSHSRGIALGVVLPVRSLVVNATGKHCNLQLRSGGSRAPWIFGEVFFRQMHAVAFDFVTQGIVIDPLERAAVLVDMHPRLKLRKT